VIFKRSGFGRADLTSIPFETFFFARPTPENLVAYERWSGSEIQTTTWLGDLVDKVYKVELVQGNTMIIPTGWIHAVVSGILGAVDENCNRLFPSILRLTLSSLEEISSILSPLLLVGTPQDLRHMILTFWCC
jgi:hypothetical protein